MQKKRINVAKIEVDLINFLRQSFIGSRLFELLVAQTIFIELESKRVALENKRNKLEALQYNYDQAKINYNVKKVKLNKIKQSFENLLFKTLKFDNSSKDNMFTTIFNYLLT